MTHKKQLEFYFDHKTFKTLRPNTERVLRRLTIRPDSGMNEELDLRDESVFMVLCRRGSSKEIIGWTLMDSRGNCQVYVHPKHRKTKTNKEISFAEHLVLELCSTYSVKGYYTHDTVSTKFWRKMNKKHDIIDKLKHCIY